MSSSNAPTQDSDAARAQDASAEPVEHVKQGRMPTPSSTAAFAQPADAEHASAQADAETRAHIEEMQPAEEYISWVLKQPSSLTDYERTLIAGNIRGFLAWQLLRRYRAAQPADAEHASAQAELADVSAAIGTNEWMDPPDGGDVTLAEQVRRMADEIKRLRAAQPVVAQAEAGMKTNNLWFMVWRRPGTQPYVTALCAYTRKDLMFDIERACGRWKGLYLRGARMEKIYVQPTDTPPGARHE